MTHSNGSHGTERRKHPRFTVVEGLIEPITLRYAGKESASNGKKDAPAQPRMQPAIMTNLSAGGMSLLIFMEPPHAKCFQMDLTLPGLAHAPIEGKIIRVHEKGETFNVGIQFTKIQKKTQKQINDMAEDHMDCETRISLRLPEACVPTCRINGLCQKPQKAPHWPPKA